MLHKNVNPKHYIPFCFVWSLQKKFIQSKVWKPIVPILMYTRWSCWGKPYFKCRQLSPPQTLQFKQLKQEVMGQIIWQPFIITGFRPQQLKISCGVTNSSGAGAIIVSARGGWRRVMLQNEASNMSFLHQREANTIELLLLHHPMKQTLQQTGAGGGPGFVVGRGDTTTLLPCRDSQTDSVTAVIY